MIDFKNKNIRNLYLIFVVFSLILSVSYMIIVERFYSHNAEKVALHNAVAKTRERESVVREFLNSSERTLLYIRRSEPFSRFLENQTNVEEIKRFFYDYTVSKPSIMQVRFIDRYGRETVRVDRLREGGEPLVVPQEMLQDKSGRYYFTDSMIRKPEKVWFSSVDLNIEHGKVQKPYNQTIRAVLPVEKDNTFKGILIINYFIGDFMQRLTYAPLYDIIVCDDNGTALFHYDESKCIGPECDDQYNLVQQFPDMADRILSESLVDMDSFVSRRLNVPIQGGLNLVLQLKKSYMDDQQKQARHQYLIISIIIFVFSSLFSVVIVRLFSNALLNLTEMRRLNEKLENASAIAQIGFWEHTGNNEENLQWSNGVYDIFEIDDKMSDISFEFFLSHIPEDQREMIQEEFRNSVMEHKEYLLSHRLNTAKGNVKYVEVRAKHIYDRNGNYIRSMGSVYDITERYMSEERYRMLLSMASDGIFIMDEDGHLIEFSNLVPEMLGYNPDEMRELTVFKWDKEISRQEYKYLMDRIGDAPITIERVHTRKDGSTYIAQITSSRVFIHNKSYIYASVRDITDLKHKEEKITAQKNELEAIFETALEGIAIINFKGVCLRANRKYCEQLGYAESELIGTCLFDLAVPEYLERSKSVIHEVSRKGFFENFERDFITRDGIRKRLKSSLVLMPGKKEILMTTVDYTELYNANITIKKQSYTDELTQLGNRKSYNKRKAELFEQFKRYGTEFSMIMFDIDHFKSINDTYGHSAGDTVLRELGVMITDSVRANDYAFRVGGEEFVVLLTQTDAENAAILAEKLRSRVESSLNVIEGRVVTISLGVTEVRKDDVIGAMYKRADENLYYAKNSGRNRVATDKRD